MTSTPTTSVRRDGYTLTHYSVLVVWGWFIYSFSPAVPLLAEDLGVSKAVAGMHGTAMAVGAVSAALILPALLRALGRSRLLIAGVVTVAVGVTAFVLGPGIAATLPALAVVALGGNIALSVAQLNLSRRHGAAAPAAITEANGVGSGIGLLGPLAVGGAVALGWGWRTAVAVTVVLAITVAWALSRLGREPHVPAADGEARADEPPALVDNLAASGPAPSAATGPDGSTRSRRLAPGTMSLLLALIAAMALENATTYWSTSLVIERTGADASIATATTAGLLVGMTAVRFLGTTLTRRFGAARVLAASFFVAIAGWAVLWTAHSPATALVGLVIAGLGYGAQYPLSIALVLGIAREGADRAQAVATFAAGATVGLAPFLLGAAADAVGTHTAFLAIPVLALIGAAGAFFGARTARAHGLL
ncbi:MFS transporter [Sanguibacter sp. A247]|uniref:MFS transporter n=1 Tax=unclassified Sanguibacter TaxID=2645534 RepID=UPI003FD79D29